MDMQYYRLSEGLNKYKLVPATEDLYSHVKSNQKDYYRSLFLYNDEQYKHWKTTGSVAGIKDVVCKSLLWDFDSADNIKLAKDDATTLVGRLVKLGIPQENIQVTFSGNKGICVEVETTKEYKQDEFKNITFALAEDLPTFDRVVNDAQRIIRITGTKHPKSGLFKIPLSINQLAELPVETIKTLAANDEVDADVVEGWKPITLPFAVEKLKAGAIKEEKKSSSETYDLDITLKPKWMSEVRFALQEGYFPSGEGKRNHAFMILASTYKKQGFNKELTYRLLKGVAEVQARRTETDRYPDVELWKNVVEVVYSPHWKGGIYKDNEDSFLIETAKALGIKINKESPSEYVPKGMHSLHEGFKDYVKNIDKNTVLTGIKSLDEHVFISTGANVGIVGAPGSGKSSLALNILNNTSRMGIKSIFASFDMARTRMYEKILYKLTGYSRDKLYNIINNNPDEEARLFKRVKEEFGNVYFYDKSAASVSDIEQYLNDCNELAQNPNERVKFIMLDYFERVNVDMNDDTAASKKVAGQLQDLVNKYNIAMLTLLQPNKMSGDMSEPIQSYTNIKGSSYLAQSFRIVLSLFREGFSPKTPENDKFLTINVLKNDLGETASLDFSWQGKRGEIHEITEEERMDLERLRQRKVAEKIGNNDL